jgi:hypothetical protein
MTGKFRARLFLTDSEIEELFELIYALENVEMESMEDWDRINTWRGILSSMIFGKKDSFPVSSGSIEIL